MLYQRDWKANLFFDQPKGLTVLTARDLRGLYAIIPTPAKPGADRVDAIDTVDLEESRRLVERLIADGTHGLIALGTTGECATLTPDEYDAFVTCVLQTIAKRVPVFIGCTALGAHEAVRRIARARDLGCRRHFCSVCRCGNHARRTWP